MGTNINEVTSADSECHSEVIMNALRKIVQVLRHSSTQCEMMSGLTGAQFFVLKLIGSNDGLSVNELAMRTCTHQSTVSEVVSRLEAKQLVQRHKSTSDGRRTEIYITSAGKEKLLVGFMTAQEYLMQAIRTFSPEKSFHLAQLLNELVQTADFSNQKPNLFFEDNHVS